LDHYRLTPQIDALEFIHSWEKSWRDLTQLDYYIYETINQVSKYLAEFFESDDEDVIDNLRFLSFLIGDHLESFLSIYCFDLCPLDCPLNHNALNKDIPLDGQKELYRIQKNLSGIKGYPKKEDLLYRDIHKFVVLETLIDFLRFDDAYIPLEKLSEFKDLASQLAHLIVNKIKSAEGQYKLRNRHERANYDFGQALLKSDDDRFANIDPDDDQTMDNLIDDMDDWSGAEEEIEDWQISQLNWEQVIQDFLLDAKAEQYGHLRSSNGASLYLFSEFIEENFIVENFTQLSNIHVHEYVYYFLPGQLNFYDYNTFKQHLMDLNMFLEWVLKNRHGLKPSIRMPLERVSGFVNRMERLLVHFRDEAFVQKLMGGQLNLVTYDNFYQVAFRNQDYLVLKATNLPFWVEIELPEKTGKYFRKNDIIDAVLIKNPGNRYRLWQINHIYPAKGQDYFYSDLGNAGEL
jgi:hypothetical protein